MRIRMLGPVECSDGRRWAGVGPAKVRELLSVLLLSPGRVVARDRLIDMLWDGGPPPATAERVLPHYVWRLRGVLPGGARRLRTAPTGYVLDVDDADLDRERFHTLVARARATGPAQAADRLAAGLALWRGPAFADARSIRAVDDAARRLDGARLEAQESLAEALLAGGRTAEALPALDELIAAEPFRDRPWRLLMLAMCRAGRRRDALVAYQRLRRMWTEQLGIEPSRELQDLHRRVLVDDPAL